MKIITKRKRVIAKPEPDFQFGIQSLYEYIYFLGIPIWRDQIDMEIVPAPVLTNEIYAGDLCFGRTGVWTSKFAPFDEQGWLTKQ